MRTHSLSRVLLFNAAYTAGCGALFLVGASSLANPFGLAQPTPLQLVGVFLLVVAVCLVIASRLVARTLIPAAILTMGDAGYIAASLAVAAFIPMTALGRGVVLAVASIVLVFATFQARLILRIRAKF